MDWRPWADRRFGGGASAFSCSESNRLISTRESNGWFVDQMVKNGFYRYDPTNYHGPLHFYVLFIFQTLLGQRLGAASAGRDRQHQLRVVMLEVRAAGRTSRQLVGSRGHGRVTRIRFLRPLFHSRSLDASFLNASRAGVAGCVAIRNPRIHLVRRHGLDRHDLTKETYVIHAGCAATWRRWPPGSQRGCHSPYIDRKSAEASDTIGQDLVLLLSGLTIMSLLLPWGVNVRRH